MPAKKILVVDADVTSRNFIVRSLSQQHHEVIQSGSAKEGLIYAWRDRPDLIIIDPRIPDLAGEEFARKLRQDARTATMPLVALSADPNPQRVKSCLDAGFNEYIPKSGQAVTALSEAVNRLLFSAPVSPNYGTSSQFANKQGGGLLMAFLSAKGGAGTSSLCANIAAEMAHQNKDARIAVMDMVLPIGSIASIVGYGGAQNIVTVSKMSPAQATPEFFRDQLTMMRSWGIYLLAGSPDPESSHNLNVERVSDMINALKMSYDYVLIDLGRSLSKFILPLIQSADLVSLIFNNDASAIELTQTLFGYLKNSGIQSGATYPILNRVVGVEGLGKPEVEKTLGLQVKYTIPYLGGNLAFASSQHAPFFAQFPNDVGAFAFREIARDMVTLARNLRM